MAGTEPLNYWFDSQLRRYNSQFCRVFQNFQYQTGRQKDNGPEFRPIPVRWALNNRQTATILMKNSENVMQSVPQIACYLSDIAIARDRTQAPYYIERKQIIERQYNEEAQAYTTEEGARYQLNRILPVPLDLTLKADVWTSNQMQKDQIFEQIIILFNPSIDLQHSDNPYDWAGLTVLELTDYQWSSRGMPIGTNDDLEVMTFTFKAPIWIQPPSWLHPQKLIHQIVMNIGESAQMEYDGLSKGWEIDWSISDLMARVITTPGNHQIDVLGDEITLLGPNGALLDPNGNPYSWEQLIELYGKIRENISQLRLKTTNNLDDESADIIGTFKLHPTEVNKLIWYVDGMTIPASTLDSISGVLDPHKTFPGNGLPIPQSSHRYMLTSEIGDSLAWGDLQAKPNDIIQWNSALSKWQVVFVADNHPRLEYVRNTKNDKLLKWTGQDWIIAVDGQYNPGFWRLFL